MITKKVQLIHQPWSIQSTYSRQNGGIFARYCWKNDAKFNLSSFSQISTTGVYFKIVKKKYRCLKTTDFNRLHIPHYDWNFFIPSKSYRILQKLGMSILNNQTESASIQASQWRLYAGIVVNYYQNGLKVIDCQMPYGICIQIDIMFISWMK